MNSLFLKGILFCSLLISSNVSVFSQNDLAKGIELYNHKDFDQAILFFKNLLKTNSSDAKAWDYLGKSQIADHKLGDAEKSFKKSISLNTNDASPHTGLAFFYLLKNKLDDAKKEAEQALTLDNRQADAHYVLGVRSFRINIYSTAYERAKKAIELSPKYKNAYLLKSESLISSFAQQVGTIVKGTNSKAELLTEAQGDLEKFIELSSDNDKDIKFYREYLESIIFFAEYYNRPENMLPTNYDVISPSTSNSTPLKVLTKPRAEYTEEAKKAGIEGTIRLLVGFSENRKIKHILVLKSLGFGLDQEAVFAATNIRFEPPTKDGKPISVVKIVEYSFILY